MEARGIHHVGLAVVDLDEAIGTYEKPVSYTHLTLPTKRIV